jgi:ferredoxin
MKVFVDSAMCQGHARCWERAPYVFELNDEGHAIVKLADVDGDDAVRAREAAKNCPEGAISVE